MQEINNVGIYCRLSHDDERAGESVSIENQKELLTRYAREQDWTVIDYYVDDGYSCTTFDRPGFNRLVQDAQGMGRSTSRSAKTSAALDAIISRLENTRTCSLPWAAGSSPSMMAWTPLARTMRRTRTNADLTGSLGSGAEHRGKPAPEPDGKGRESSLVLRRCVLYGLRLDHAPPL